MAARCLPCLLGRPVQVIRRYRPGAGGNSSFPSLVQCEAQYRQYRQSLAAVGWSSEGYVQDRGPGAGGPCYQWTRKVKAKTVSVVAVSLKKKALKQAIENWHQL